MRVVAIKNLKGEAENRLIRAMHRLRARIFRGQLAWKVRGTSGLERGNFDKLGSAYVLRLDRCDAVVGCARLLKKVFPTPGNGASLNLPSNDRKPSILPGHEHRGGTGAGGPSLGDARDVCRHRRLEHPQRLQGIRDRDGRQAQAHPPSCGLASEPSRRACTD